jgi:hypothetical protein
LMVSVKDTGTKFSDTKPSITVLNRMKPTKIMSRTNVGLLVDGFPTELGSNFDLAKAPLGCERHPTASNSRPPYTCTCQIHVTLCYTCLKVIRCTPYRPTVVGKTPTKHSLTFAAPITQVVVIWATASDCGFPCNVDRICLFKNNVLRDVRYHSARNVSAAGDNNRLGFVSNTGSEFSPPNPR